jgi:PTS system mannose-specific IIA component
MIKIIILTHGSLGAELLKTAEMIIGKQDNIDILSIQAGVSLSDIATKLDIIIEKNQMNGILIFTDMFGGSPSNIAMSYLVNENVEVLTGVNLPMLLKALTKLKEDITIKDFAKKISKSGLESIIIPREILKK